MTQDNFALQTKVAIAGIAAIWISSLISIFIRNEAGNWMAWISFVIMTGVFALALYTLNCVVIGKCQTLAWIYVALYILLGVLAILGMVFSFFARKKIESVRKSPLSFNKK